MKHIKTFENLNKEPKVGDYIIAKLPEFEELDDFLLSNIGVIDSIYFDGGSYEVIYKNVPRNFRHFFSYESDNHNTYTIEIFKDDILHFSENIKDLEIFIDSNKYNL